MVTYADVVAKVLADAQMAYIVGMPGSRASVELIEAARTQGMTYVLSNNEAAAAVMAATYGVWPQRPGVCAVGVGPGATHVINGVAHALLERAPMLRFTDRYPDELYRHLPRQRIDQEQLFRPGTKGSFPIADDRAARSVQRALQLAMEGRPGPVHLDLQDDVMQHEAVGLPEPFPMQQWHGAVSAEHPAVQSLAAAMNAAARPIVIAGLGVNRNSCEAQRQALAEQAHLPILCAVSAKGSLADDHPWCGGTFMGSEANHGLLAESDLIVTIGLDVVELFEPGLWPYHQRVLNIDSVPHQDGLFHPSQELVGDIGEALQALTPLLTPRSGWRPADLAAFRQRQQPPVTPSGARLSPAAALRIMRQILPRDTILTADAGQHKVYASRLWECYQPLDYLTSSGLGTMGVAIPIAIATKLVRRQRPVVALTGDGGFLMRVSELETARRANTPIIIVIFNDGYLNLIKIKQERQGYAVLGSQFAPVDFAQVATGFGFRAVRADTEAVLQDALQQAVASGEPWVIDAIVDPEGYV